MPGKTSPATWRIGHSPSTFEVLITIEGVAQVALSPKEARALTKLINQTAKKVAQMKAGKF